MNLLIVTGIFPPDIGGPATYVPQVSAALAERGHVRPGARLVTDEWPGYSRLRSYGYRHHRVPHEETYVKGHKHTNTVEGFWSLLKRRIRAIHTKVGKKYLDYYLAEASFRYNLRLRSDRLKATFQACLVQLRG